MKPLSRKSFIVGGALVMGLALVGCGTTPKATSAAKKNTTGASNAPKNVPIKLGYQKTFWGAPAMTAVTEPYFKQSSLQVSGVALSSGKAIRDAVLSGNVNIGAMGTTPFILGAAKGNLVVIGVVAYAGKTLAVVTKKGEGIKTLSDLKGKKIASQLGSSTNQILVSKVLPSAGLKKGSYKEINTTFQNMVSALASGSVDAFAGVEPYVSLAVQKGVGVKLVDYGKFDMTPLVLVAQKSFVQKHPQEVNKFLTDWKKSISIFKNNPNKAASTVKSLFAKEGWSVPTATVKSGLSEMNITTKYVSNFKNYLNNQANTLKKEGKISSIPNWSQDVIKQGSLK